MTNTQLRDLVKGAYSGPGWATRVNEMTDEQVYAIYNRLVSQGKINV